MIKQAITREAELIQWFLENGSSTEFDHYKNSQFSNFELVISKNNWEKVQYVSVNDEGKLLGYIEISIDRSARVMENLNIFKIHGPSSSVFLNDILVAIEGLVRSGFVKLEFSVSVENKLAMKLYDKLAALLDCETFVRRKHFFSKSNMNKLDDCKIYDVFFDTGTNRKLLFDLIKS